MRAFWLLLPLLAVRFGLMGWLDKAALRRAAYFPPLIGKEKAAFLFYQVSNLFLFVYPFFLAVVTDGILFYAGLAVYALGILVCVWSVVNFAKPGKGGINETGIYRISRNPMYLGYFLYFLGCGLLARSIILLAALAVFQFSAHWIILSEERWCIQEFGEAYIRYMKRVRRYL